MSTETKSTQILIRAKPSVKEALDKAAKDDVRSVSSLIEKILVEWLKAKGYLPNG